MHVRLPRHPRGSLTLPDIATISILHERALARTEVVVDQLQGALNSRVVIEQAKGILSSRGEVDIDVAFTYLRRFARTHNLRLAELAHAVVASDDRVGEVLRFVEMSRRRID